MKRLSAILGDRALLLVIAIVAVNAYAIHDELTAGRFDLNDSVFHYTLIDRMAQAIQQGENPLDCWVSEWTLGYPVPRTYQILGHLSIAVLYLALGKTISVLTLFVWARFLLVALLPLTVYACARLLRLPRTAAVASALVSPLVATNGLFGLEYGAYLWRGDGLFAQAAAMHLLLLTLAYAFRAVRGMSSVVRAGLFLGLTFLTHFIYGFIGAISVVLLVFIPQTASLTKRVVRIAAIAIVSFGVAAFQLVPILQDGWLVNHSRWEAQWKWDSFGARYVFANLLRGSLFDFGRLPVLSLLALLGSIVCVVKFRNMKEDSSKIDTADGRAPAATYIFLVAGAGLWALMFCGRPTWGVLFTILGARNVQLHRLIGGLHAFGFFWEELG